MSIVIPHNVKAKYLSGGLWKAKQRSAKNPKQTPGKDKNPTTCQATAAKKFFAKRARSYKSNGFGEFSSYSDWCHKMQVINGGK